MTVKRTITTIQPTKCIQIAFGIVSALLWYTLKGGKERRLHFMRPKDVQLYRTRSYHMEWGKQNDLKWNLVFFPLLFFFFFFSRNRKKKITKIPSRKKTTSRATVFQAKRFGERNWFCILCRKPYHKLAIARVQCLSYVVSVC